MCERTKLHRKTSQYELNIGEIVRAVQPFLLGPLVPLDGDSGTPKATARAPHARLSALQSLFQLHLF